MRILVKILPPINLKTRLPSVTTNRCCTSLVQVESEKHRNQNLSCNNSVLKVVYRTNDGIKAPTRDFYNAFLKEIKDNLNLAIAFTEGHGSDADEMTVISKHENVNLQNSAIDENQKVMSPVEHNSANADYFDSLPDALNKRLVEIFDNTDLQLHPVEHANARHFNNTIKVKPDFQQKNMLSEMKGFLNSSFPVTLTKKAFSTSTSVWRPKNESEIKTPTKSDPNYDFPYLSKIFGTDNLLMRSDAYNQALVEAAKRRAALDGARAASKQVKNFRSGRPRVMNIKGCTNPQLNDQHVQKSEVNPPNFYLPPLKPMQQTKEVFENFKAKEEIVRKKILEMPNQNLKDTFLTERPIIKVKDTYNKNDASYKLPGYSTSHEMENDKLRILAKKVENKSDEYKSMSDSSGKAKGSKQKNPCLDEDKEYQPKCNEDPCKENKPSGEESAKSKDPCVRNKQKQDRCQQGRKKSPSKKKENPCKKRKDSVSSGKQKEDPSRNDKQKSDCPMKKGPCADNKQREDAPKKEKQKENPCKKQKEDPGSKKKDDSCGKRIQKDSCKKKSPCGDSKPKEDPCNTVQRQQDPCKSRESSNTSKQKEDPCKKQKEEDPFKKKNPCESSKSKVDSLNKEKQKEDPCKKQNEDTGSKKKDDICGKRIKKENSSKKKSPCGDSKPKEDPCNTVQQQPDPCNQKENPCKKKNPCEEMKPKQNPEGQDKTCFEKEKPNPCKTNKASPCESVPKKDQSSTTALESQRNIKAKDEKLTNCSTPKKETKPNCGKDKCFSASTTTSSNQSSCSIIKRTLMTLPTLKCENFYNWDSKRQFSSKGDSKKSKKNMDSLARSSQCKAVGVQIPSNRKPAYNPRPIEGLRQCYPTYDMDCKKFCKDKRKTNCKPQAYLKDTDTNKRSNNK